MLSASIFGCRQQKQLSLWEIDIPNMCTFQVRGPHFYCPEKLESRVQNLALAVSAEQVQHIHKTLYSAYAQAETRRTPPEKATPSKNELIINKNKLQKEFEQTLHENRYPNDQ